MFEIVDEYIQAHIINSYQSPFISHGECNNKEGAIMRSAYNRPKNSIAFINTASKLFTARMLTNTARLFR